MTWTDDKDDQLRGHWRNGLTAGRIADVMGLSPSSVTGRVRRLGLSPRPSPMTGARRVTDKTTQERTDLAELMAEGAVSVSAAARTMRITQSRADRHWQDIKRDLGAQAV